MSILRFTHGEKRLLLSVYGMWQYERLLIRWTKLRTARAVRKKSRVRLDWYPLKS
jgi:hypothetical protein